MAEVTIARESDFGVNDTQFTVLTHLGGIVKEGDTVLCYDLSRMSWTNDLEHTSKLRYEMPDVILVRKVSMYVCV